jgi:hypothetical protein
MCLVNSRIRIQNRVAHHPIDEVVDDGCNSVDPAEAIIEGGYVGSGIHRRLPPSRVKARLYPSVEKVSPAYFHDLDLTMTASAYAR